jgi:hypothetical protein
MSHCSWWLGMSKNMHTTQSLIVLLYAYVPLPWTRLDSTLGERPSPIVSCPCLHREHTWELPSHFSVITFFRSIEEWKICYSARIGGEHQQPGTVFFLTLHLCIWYFWSFIRGEYLITRCYGSITWTDQPLPPKTVPAHVHKYAGMVNIWLKAGGGIWFYPSGTYSIFQTDFSDSSYWHQSPH